MYPLKCILLLFIQVLFIGSLSAFAQGENNNWLFRYKTKLAFNTGNAVYSPTNRTMGMSTPSAISDCMGNLLFFSDGHSVWDKNQNPMPTGNATLLGGEADSGAMGSYDGQPVLILTWPNDLNKYFVLTTSSIHGFRYSVVDLTLNNGLGDLVILNNFVEDNVTGKITATASSDGGYWVIIQKKDLPIFHVYKIDQYGLNPNPVINQFSYSIINTNKYGALKASTDGSLIGEGSYYTFRIYKFDNSTGLMTFLYSPQNQGINFGGLEFSQDNKKLYAIGGPPATSITINEFYQYDLSTLDPVAIDQSQLLIYTSNNHYSDFSLAPNGKIYIFNWWAMYLSVINNPNNLGFSCNYVDNHLFITNQSPTTLGMQNQVNSVYNQKITISNSCLSDTTKFKYTGSSCIDSVLWKFNDPLSADDTAAGWQASHKYAAPGVYQVKLVRYFSYKIDTLYESVSIVPYALTTLGPDTTLCSNSTYNLNAGNPGMKYLWNTGDTTQSITIDTTGVYWVRVSNNNCFTYDTVSITLLPIYNFNISNDTIICSNGTASLSVNGSSNLNYSWSPANTLSCSTCSNPIASPLFTTIYTLTATDINGCTASKTVTVIVKTAPNATASAATTCAGIPAQLNASGGPIYSWQPAAFVNFPTLPNPKATVQNTTTFTVTVTGNNGCSSTAMATVNVFPTPVLTVPIRQQICSGSSVQLTASGTGTFSWSPTLGLSCTNCPNPVASPVNTTVYTVSLTGTNGCVAKDSVKVEVFQNIPVTATGAQACIGEGAQLLATGGVSYSWTPSNGLSDPLTADPIAFLNSTTTFTVTVTDAAGCTGTATATVNVLPAPALIVSGDTTICQGASTAISATGTGTFYWSPAAGLSDPNIKNPIASPFVKTVYTATLTDANGCKSTSPVTITVDSLPALMVSDVSVCAGEPVQMSVNSNAVSFNWSPLSGLNNSVIKEPVVTLQNTTIYTVAATGANNCKAEASVTVTVLPLPALSVSGDTIICAGDTIQISAVGIGNFIWTPTNSIDNPNINNPLVSPVSATNFSVTLTDNNGCKSVDSIKVDVLPLPVLIVSGDTSICKNTNAFLSVNGAANYKWEPSIYLSNSNIQNPIATLENTTVFTVTGTTGNCSATASILVMIFPDDLIDAGPDLEVCEGEKITLSATGGTGYQWQPEQFLDDASMENPIATVNATTIFTVSAIDINGCISRDTIQVFYLLKPKINAGADVSIFSGRDVQLNATGADTYLWQPGQFLNDSTIADPVAAPIFTTIYTVFGTSLNGCTDSDEVVVTVNDEEFVFLPTAFSPNGDGTNDLYIPKYNPNFHFEKLVIFNRWGEQIFETNDPTLFWDGHIKNGIAPLGTYAVMVKGTVDGSSKIIKKNLTVLR